MITPDKKNTIIKNTIKNNKKLKKRITIEHTNLEIKKYDRCNVRKERKINNFLSWIYISSSLNNIKN
jgi:transposase